MTKIKGFNLIEILISLVIIAILASIATPFSSNILSKWQMKSVIQDIESAVTLARNLALTQARVIYIEPINKNSWSSGIQVVQVEASSAKSIVHIFQWFYPKLHVHWSGFQYKDKIRFANNLINAGSNGHFIIELAGNKQKIVLNRIGRIRSIT